MKLYGLIGFPLSHSFSKKYFTEKFEKERILDSKYELFEIDSIKKLTTVLESNPDLIGLNVTIPYKQEVIPYLDEIDDAAKEIGAVNVIKLENGKLKGYNSDYFGFKVSLEKFLGNDNKPNALILGTGGASKAVAKALSDLGINYNYVSRKGSGEVLDYNEARNKFSHYRLIINTSPLGMYPKVDTCADLPYDQLDSSYFLYDLVYNPEETLFLKKGRFRGAKTHSGMQMLVGQAEKAYEIWSKK